MKYLLPSLIFFLTACQPKSLPTVTDYNDTGAIVKLSHETTKDELAQIANEIEARYQISMDFSNTTFLESGTLRDLSVQLRGSKDTGGNFKVPLTNLQYGYSGFVIDQQDDGKFYVKKVGNMQQ